MCGLTDSYSSWSRYGESWPSTQARDCTLNLKLPLPKTQTQASNFSAKAPPASILLNVSEWSIKNLGKSQRWLMMQFLLRVKSLSQTRQCLVQYNSEAGAAASIL